MTLAGYALSTRIFERAVIAVAGLIATANSPNREASP